MNDIALVFPEKLEDPDLFIRVRDYFAPYFKSSLLAKRAVAYDALEAIDGLEDFKVTVYAGKIYIHHESINVRHLYLFLDYS